ncbi:MAG TPA: hypothetical protein VFD92_23855 [Candidatus Binatia bacterium]|nr:hypothetical protein [Candidatus Binatia bacterium]
MFSRTMLSTLVAAAPRALLSLTVAAGIGAPVALAQGINSDMQGAPKDAPVVPGVYDEELCVVSIDKDARFVTFMAPNPENPNAAVAFVFKSIEGFKKGDLVKLSPAKDTKAGQPTVKVLEAGSAKCKRYS